MMSHPDIPVSKATHGINSIILIILSKFLQKGCFDDPPCVLVSACQQLIMYLVMTRAQSSNYSLPVMKWQHTEKKQN